MDNTPEQSQLGKSSTYVADYDASLLYPMPRALKRAEIGIGSGALPFQGTDFWTAYELSWLTPRGKPEVAIARFTVPAASTHIVESKSLKLYLNSFNNTAFTDASEVQQRIRDDLTQAVWQGTSAGSAPASQAVAVDLMLPNRFAAETVQELSGTSLDRLDIACDRYEPAPDLLTADAAAAPISETLTSNLLKSNCLVTGQPDWGSLRIAYTGPPIDHVGLLQYIVSYRNHNEFHEQCVERIFMDLTRRCRPARLDVSARYTRRGGLDINPWRTSHTSPPPPHLRTARQ